MTLASAFAAGALSLAAANQSEMDAYFNQLPTYNRDDLELTVTPSTTSWRLWSPMAEEVRLFLYDKDRNTAPTDTIALEKAPQGTWTASVNRPLYGKFYTFQIKHNGKWLKETPGAWAKAVGTNGERAAIIDFSATNPEGWDSDRGPAVKNITDAVIY